MDTDRKVKIRAVTCYTCVFFSKTLCGVETSDSKNARDILLQKSVLILAAITKILNLLNIGNHPGFALPEGKICLF